MIEHGSVGSTLVLHSIVRGATTLQEHLRHVDDGASTASAETQAERVFASWRQALSSEALDVCLERRLSWSALDRRDVVGVLAELASGEGGATFSPEPSAVPAWARMLGDLAVHTKRWFQLFEPSVEPRDVPPSAAFVAANDPLPFEELFVPAVQFASRALLDKLGRSVPSRLGASAFQDLQRQLLMRLTTISEKTLFNEFNRTRSYGRNVVLSVRDSPPKSLPRRDYLVFVTRHGRLGLGALLHSYPVLGRLLATVVDSWIEATAELIVRLERDWRELLRFIDVDGSGYQSQQVERIRTGIADSHRGGREVLILTLGHGQRVVYKPRDLRLHEYFRGFLDWCTKSAGITLSCPRVLTGQGYGWVEYVEALPAADVQDVRRFYEQAGGLLCIVYLLGGTDCHFENLIARGRDLLLLDTETLFHAEMADEADGDFPVDSTSQVWESVLRTGLLPSWEFSVNKRVALDLSGLGSDQLPPSLHRGWAWSAVNTDDMHRRVTPRKLFSLDNVPIFNGLPVDPASFVDELAEGFALAYRALMCHREQLLDPGGPLGSFRDMPTRFVFRPTKVYAAILERSLVPEVMRSGVRWGIELEVLARTFTASTKRPKAWPLFDVELDDLVRFDIPYFTASTTSTCLQLSGDRTIDILGRTAWSTVRARIAAMTRSDLSFQLEIIRGAYAARSSAVTAPPGVTDVADPEAPPLADDVCLAEASALAAELTRRALRDDRGKLQWLGFAYVPEAERLELDLVPPGLYDGRCGIALFLAALDRVQARNQYLPVWTSALEPIRRLLTQESAARREFARSGLGLATGFGGMVYAFVRLAALAPASERAWLTDAAAQAATWITRPIAERDDLLDLLGGGAGAIVGLLALHELTGDGTVLERAVWCGRRLALEYPNRLASSRPARRPLLTGFSHGASGVAFALMTLFARTDEPLFKRTALRALRYEADAYDVERANWPDYRLDPARPHFQTSWCHGAPGIALARLGMLACGADARRGSEWKTAIEKTQQVGLLATDHLCCGNFGLVDVLLTSARHRDRDDLRASATALAARVVHRAHREGGFRLFAGSARSVFNPGLFQGAAGIGYELLRVARPDLVSSVLLFES